MASRLNNLTILRNRRSLFGLAIVGLFALIGVSLLVTSQAATFVAQQEAENGNRSGGAVVVTASGASGGQAVRFTAGTTPPPPPATTTFIGACPIASEGGTAADLITKWGSGTAQRSFTGGGFNVAPKPNGISQVHHSWKPTLGQAITDQQIISSVANLDDGDFVTLWHETPVKYRNGSLSLAETEQSLAMQNDFHARVVRLRQAGTIPMLYTVFVDAAWMWDSPSLYPGTANDPGSAEYWGQRINADYVGIDTDAYANLTRYPDFTNSVENVQAFIKKFPKFKGWTVPEIMHPRIDSDPSGSQRATWITNQVNMMLSQPVPPKAIHLFDTNHRPNQVFLPGSPEFNAWKALLQASLN
jgi:hypothetical protein